MWQIICNLPVLAISLLFAVSSASIVQAQPVEWKFAKGDSFQLKMTQSSQVNTMVDRRDVDQQNRMTLDIDWLVEEVDEDGTAIIRQLITRVQVEMTMPSKEGPQEIMYDSDQEDHKGPARRMASSFSRIVNQPVHVTMSSRGEITNVDIPDETMEMLRQMPGSMQGRKMFELDQLRSTFAHAGTMLPTEPVSEGDSWQVDRDFTINTPQQFVRSDRYEIGPVNDGALEIRFSSTVKPGEGPSSGEGAGDTIEFEDLEISEQDSSGTLFFDTAQGHCRSSQSKLSLETRSRYRDMEFKVRITSESSLTVQRTSGDDS